MSENKPPLVHMILCCILGLHRHAHERQLMCKELTPYERSYECMQLWLHEQTNPTRLFSIEPNDVLSSNQPVSLSVQPEIFHCQYYRKEGVLAQRCPTSRVFDVEDFNPLKPELNPICYLLALLGAHHFLHVSRIRVKLLTLR